jgi:hypothetical protein
VARAHIGGIVGAAVQAVGLAMSLAALWGNPSHTPDNMRVAAFVAIGIAGLRATSSRRRLAPSTLVLDAFGMAILLATTGVGASPFVPLAAAGAAWASMITRNAAPAIYAMSFTIGFAAIGGPVAVANESVPSGILVLLAILGTSACVALYSLRTEAERVRRRELMRRARSLPIQFVVELPQGEDTPTVAQGLALEELLETYSQSSATSTPGATSDSKRAYSASVMW